MPYIKKITIPNGDGTSTTYDIRDQEAWEQLSQHLEKKIVQVLPDPTNMTTDEINEALRSLYLVPESESGDDLYQEWVLIDNGVNVTPRYHWEKIGTTATDLSGYSLKGHTHQVTPQTRVADHDFTVSGTLPDLSFTGSPSTVSGDVTLSSGDVTIGISSSTSSGATEYTPEISIMGDTEVVAAHTHSIKKNQRYLERTTVRGVSSTASSETVMAHNDNYTDTTHERVLKLNSNASSHSHTIPAFEAASLTGALTVGTNIATDGELDDVASGNNANAVFHSASVDSSGVLSFGLKQLKKNVSAVTGLGTLGTDAEKTTTTGQDSFSVYHSGDTQMATIKNWDLKEATLSIPTIDQNGTVVATGALTDTATYESTGNASVVVDILSGTAQNPSTGSTSSVNTSNGGSHTHELTDNNIFLTGTPAYFSGSLTDGGGTISNGTVTPSGSVSYTGGASWTSGNVHLSHTVYNPTVFTSPDDNEANHANDWYGVTWNEDTDANPDKSFGRIGNMTYHQTLPVQSRMVRCVLNDDGTVNYYLDPNDSTKKYNGTYNGVTSDGSSANLTGTDGNVMVEVPEHWYYVTKDSSGNITAMVSPTSQVGWIHMPKYYVSAYECCGTTSKMTSISNANPIKTNGLATSRTAARANGSSGQYKWNMYPYFIHIDLYWLYVIEYANTNCQADVNNELLDGKYRQGGLGVGCTLTSLTLNNNDPANLTGKTNSLGNASGEVSVNNSGTTVKIPSYRGIENFFGHIAKQVDGVLIDVTGGSSATVAEAFVCTKPSNFSSTSTTNYTSLGTMSTSTGYINRLLIGDSGRGWALSSYSGGTGASSTTYYCDGNGYSHNNNGKKMAMVGGCCGNSSHVYGSNAGIAALVYSYSTSSDSNAASTTRLVWYDESLE